MVWAALSISTFPGIKISPFQLFSRHREVAHSFGNSAQVLVLQIFMTKGSFLQQSKCNDVHFCPPVCYILCLIFINLINKIELRLIRTPITRLYLPAYYLLLRWLK